MARRVQAGRGQQSWGQAWGELEKRHRSSNWLHLSLALCLLFKPWDVEVAEEEERSCWRCSTEGSRLVLYWWVDRDPANDDQGVRDRVERQEARETGQSLLWFSGGNLPQHNSTIKGMAGRTGGTQGCQGIRNGIRVATWRCHMLLGWTHCRHQDLWEVSELFRNPSC